MERTSIQCPHCQNIIQYKRCRNCNHFTPYYFEQSDGSYHRIDRGQCSVHPRKDHSADSVCVNWNGDIPERGEPQ